MFIEFVLYVRMSGTVVGTGDTSVNTTDKNPSSHESYIPETQTINKVNEQHIQEVAKC